MMQIKRDGNKLSIRCPESGLGTLKTTANTPEEAALALIHYFGSANHGTDQILDCPFCRDMRREAKLNGTHQSM